MLVIRLVCNDLKDFPVAGGAFRSEVGFQVHAGAPVLKSSGGLSHDRVNPAGAQGFRDFLHFPGAAFPMDDHSPNDIIRELLPVQTRERVLARGGDTG